MTDREPGLNAPMAPAAPDAVVVDRGLTAQRDGDEVAEHIMEGAGTGPDPTAPPIVQGDPELVGSAEPLGISPGGEHLRLGAGGAGAGGPGGKRRLGDRVFFGFSAGASGFVVLIVVLIGTFLLVQSIPSIVHDKVNFFSSFDWSTSKGDLRFGIATLLWTTVIISIIALLIAVPLAISIALFITHYAPKRIARPVAYVIDLLAAIPSIIYGIWGARELSQHLTGVQNFLNHLDFIPLFKHGFSTGTVFDGAIVLAVMILPIVTAISRDVFDRTPTANIEAALALGATRWEMIRMAVLPFGRPGVISGAMLGLGRALGETVAIYIILSKTSNFSFSIFNGGETFASKIANNQAEFGNNPGPYIAAGLVLFVLTFIVNAAARAIVNRRKEFA